ncbi:MAG: hypothetical protein ACYDA1_04855 [Vulcanimicrobiaceae bacterium]
MIEQLARIIAKATNIEIEAGREWDAQSIPKRLIYPKSVLDGKPAVVLTPIGIPTVNSLEMLTTGNHEAVNKLQLWRAMLALRHIDGLKLHEKLYESVLDALIAYEQSQGIDASIIHPNDLCQIAIRSIHGNSLRIARDDFPGLDRNIPPYNTSPRASLQDVFHPEFFTQAGRGITLESLDHGVELLGRACLVLFEDPACALPDLPLRTTTIDAIRAAARIPIDTATCIQAIVDLTPTFAEELLAYTRYTPPENGQSDGGQGESGEQAGNSNGNNADNDSEPSKEDNQTQPSPSNDPDGDNSENNQEPVKPDNQAQPSPNEKNEIEKRNARENDDSQRINLVTAEKCDDANLDQSPSDDPNGATDKKGSNPISKLPGETAYYDSFGGNDGIALSNHLLELAPAIEDGFRQISGMDGRRLTLHRQRRGRLDSRALPELMTGYAENPFRRQIQEHLKRFGLWIILDDSWSMRSGLHNPGWLRLSSPATWDLALLTTIALAEAACALEAKVRVTSMNRKELIEYGSTDDILKSYGPIGGTNLATPMTNVLQDISRSGSHSNLVVICTDGELPQHSLKEFVAQAQSENIQIKCLAFGEPSSATIPIDVLGKENVAYVTPDTVASTIFAWCGEIGNALI